jgi:hypothetical protein
MLSLHIRLLLPHSTTTENPALNQISLYARFMYRCFLYLTFLKEGTVCAFVSTVSFRTIPSLALKIWTMGNRHDIQPVVDVLFLTNGRIVAQALPERFSDLPLTTPVRSPTGNWSGKSTMASMMATRIHHPDMQVTNAHAPAA